MKFFLVANLGYTLTKFRKELFIELSKRGEDVYLLCPAHTDFDNEMNKYSEHHIPVNLNRGGINPFIDILTLIDFYKKLQNYKPDIILNFTIKPAIYMSLVAGLFSNSKIYSNLTGLGYIFSQKGIKVYLLRLLVIFLYKVSLRYNEKVFFQNPDDASLFLKYKIVKKNQIVLLNGSGLNISEFRKNIIDVVKLPYSFIFVGRILKDKGVGELIESYKEIKKRHPQVILTLIGDIDEDNPNSFKRNDISIWENECGLRYLGRVEDVREELLRHQVFVLPSYREGTPRSALEAMALKLPIIVTDVPGCREVIKDKINGIKIALFDISQLTDAMEFFIENQTQILSMGEESYNYVCEKFDVIQVNNKILKTIMS
jgi:glycosyltransferase involved in cell wall biosynthesis